MPRTARIPEALRPAVEAACVEIVRLAPRYLGAAEMCRTEVLAVEARSHSTSTLVQLSADGAANRFYLKTLVADAANRELKRAQIAQEYALLEDLSHRFQPYEGLGVITPVRCWPDMLSMLTEEFAGETLDRVISRARIFRSPRRARHVAELCRLVGRWLSLFQAFTKPMDGRPFDVASLVGYCERRLGLLRQAADGAFTSDFSRAVGAHVKRLAREAEAGDLSAVGRQNDFRPDNILTDGRRIVVLDFTGFTYGPPLYDFMKFWMKLEDLQFSPLFSRRAVARWRQAFLAGYGAPVDFTAPLCRLLRVANVLDKMSEVATTDLARSPLGRRLLLARWYAAQHRWLRRAVGVTGD